MKQLKKILFSIVFIWDHFNIAQDTLCNVRIIITKSSMMIDGHTSDFFLEKKENIMIYQISLQNDWYDHDQNKK